ncbi:DUF5995 family protein [Actinacidiphila sp. ITFR-21]|uniref:DUF5995 family protein n=1 Tax=Actinacidiphila sp. ITFR-21 TaxID=3075199 RepID=UPI00288957EA|nr:DUF5995 family protein [Streptomyces sp. ITFR-21]WNI14614.1 DUF5995 family protein [Streptomyces sp. ITFR-21]
MTTAGRPEPADVGRVLSLMRGLDSALPRTDGVAVFNRVYLSVTEEMRRRLAAGVFADPYAAGELAARFAGRYLAAVEDDRAGRRPPDCWRPLLRLRGHRGIRPVQFALAGINAHVGHDLPLAVVDTCRATGRAPQALEGDFDRVGEVLTAIERRVREELMPGPDLLEAADPLTHVVGVWSLERAREAAWAAARLLWALRGGHDAYEECVTRLDAGVGLVGRFLLTPLRG